MYKLLGITFLLTAVSFGDFLEQTLHSTTAWQSLGVETIDDDNDGIVQAAWWLGDGDGKTTTNNGVTWKVNGEGVFNNTDFDFEVGDVVTFQVEMYKEYIGGHEFDALRVFMDDNLIDDIYGNSNEIWYVESFDPDGKSGDSKYYTYEYIFTEARDYELTARVTCSEDLHYLDEHDGFWGSNAYNVTDSDWSLFDADVNFTVPPSHGQGETECYVFSVSNVPEPTLISLLGCGLLGLFLIRRKKS